MVPRYGIEGICLLDADKWELDEEMQQVATKDEECTVIGLFDWVSVRIEADDKDFRNKTLLTFENFIEASQVKDQDTPGDVLNAIQKEMFPNRIQMEAN